MQQQLPDNYDGASPQSADLFRLMIENIKAYAIFVMDTERRVISWNPGVEKLLGYAENEIVGQLGDIIFTPEDRAAGIPIKEQETAVREGSAENTRWHQRKDGSRFWANGMLMSLKNEDGKLRGFAKVMRDDTGQKRVEGNLEQTTRRFENVLESITDCFFILDMERRFTFVNSQTEAYFGIPKEHILGRFFTEVLPKLKGHEILRRHDEAISEHKPVHFEALSPVTGKWVELHLYPTKEGLAVYFRDVSKRKQAEEQLRESREKLKFVLGSANIGDWELDLTTGQATRSFLHDQCFGATEPFADWSYEKFLTFVHPEDRAEVERKFGKALSEQKEWHFECRIVWADGSVHWIEAQGNIYHTVDEKPVRMVGIVNDITERKQAEEKILESEKRYRTLFNSIDEGFCIIELIFDENNQPIDYRFVEINPTFEKQTGLVEAHGRTMRELLPNLESRWFEIYGRVALTGESIRFVEDSEVMGRWFDVFAFRVGDENSRQVAVLFNDITTRRRLETERNRAEQELQQSLKQLEAERSRLAYLFTHAPALVVTLEGENHIFEMANPAYLQLIGRRDVVGKPVREAMPELEGQGFLKLLDNVYRTGEPFIGRELPVEIQRQPGGALEKRYFDFVYQPIFDRDKKVTGIFGHGVDITEQVEARKQAESANRLKDEFLATLSHELRTPLNAILGWSQMLQNDNLDQNQRQKALAIIERSARSQNQLIEDLLDVSRIITGKLRLDVRAVDLSSVISAAVDAARPAAEAKNIRIQVLLDPEAALISGDPDRLQQVVWNLLSNAIKFTPKDGRVQVRLERVNSHVEIVVSDTGKGIEPKFLLYVFDRFRQSDGSMTRRHGGLGLGLAIVRQLVELHGGTVSVESKGEGLGSTFIVSLPLLPIRLEPEEDLPRVHPTTQNGSIVNCPPELSGLHVLLVDD